MTDIVSTNGAEVKSDTSHTCDTSDPYDGGTKIPGTDLRWPYDYALHRGNLCYRDKNKGEAKPIMVGYFVILAKCTIDSETFARIGFRTYENARPQTANVPWPALASTSKIIDVLAGVGLNVNSLHAGELVRYVSAFMHTNAATLDRPIANRTGWHGKAFALGREVIGDPQLQAEYSISSEIALQFVATIHCAGDREAHFAALREAVKYPVQSAVIAASCYAAMARPLGARTIGISIPGIGGSGKTRTIKNACSVWGKHGSADGLAAEGFPCSSNCTLRAFENAAAARNDLPLVITDLSPKAADAAKITDLLHGIINGDARARCTATGGDTLGPAFKCGAVIVEGEIELSARAMRQGFHRRVLELRPDEAKDELYRIATITSENYGHTGRALVESLVADPPKAERLAEIEASLPVDLDDHNMRSIAAGLILAAERVAPIIGADAALWRANILQVVEGDREQKQNTATDEVERATEAIETWLLHNGQVIASNPDLARNATNEQGRPYVGYFDKGEALAAVVIHAKTLEKALVDAGVQSPTSVLREFRARGWLTGEAKRLTVKATLKSGRVRCYNLSLPDLDPPDDDIATEQGSDEPIDWGSIADDAGPLTVPAPRECPINTHTMGQA